MNLTRTAEQLTLIYRAISIGLTKALYNSRGITILNDRPLAMIGQPYDISKGFDNFRKHVTESRHLYVSSDFSESSIYGRDQQGIHGNDWFRHVHDLGHLLYACEFDYAGETELHKRLWAWIETSAIFHCLRQNEQALVYLVYMADTQGQTDYFEEHGEFPTDQAAFIRDYVERHRHETRAA